MANHALQPPTTPLASPAPIAAAGFAGALLAGLLLARDVQIGVAVMLAVLYVPIVMLNLPLGLVLWIPLIFVERLPATSFGPTLVLMLVGAAWLGALPMRSALVGAFARRHQVLLWLLLMMLVWITLSIFWSQNAGAALEDFWAWLVAGAVFFVVATSFADRRYLPLACAAFVVGAVISLAVGLVPGAIDRAAVGGELAADEASRLGGSYGDPNFLAAGLVPAMALAAGLTAVWRGTAARWVLGSAVVVLGIGLAATGSRGGLVAAGVSVLAALVLARGRRVELGALVALGVTVTGLWVATSSPETWERVRSFDTGTGRVDLWTIAGRMTADHPIEGVGINNFRSASAEYIRQPGRLQDVELIVERPLVAHNTYLQQFAETGIVGALLLIAVLLGALRATWQAGRRFTLGGDARMAGLARALLVAQVAVLSASIFMSNGYDKRIWVLLALGVAMFTVAVREDEARQARG